MKAKQNKTIIKDCLSPIIPNILGDNSFHDFGYTYQFDTSAIQASLQNYQTKLPNADSKLYSAVDADCKLLISQMFPRLQAMPAEEVVNHLNLSTSAGPNHPGKTKAEALHITPDNPNQYDRGNPFQRYDPTTPMSIAIKMVRSFRLHWREHQDRYHCSLGIKPKCYQYEPILHPESNQESTDHSKVTTPFSQNSIISRSSNNDDNTQIFVSKTKGRIIWSVPIEVVLFEGQYACPYYQWIKQHQQCPILLGRDNKARMFQYVTEVSDKTRVTLDWSQFDSRVPGWLIAIVIRELVKNVDFLYGEDLDETICILQSYFIHTRVVSQGFGVDFTKHQGIPSGSMFTQIVGSICNMLVVRYCLTLRGVFFGDHLVLGDDTIFSLDTNNRQYAEMVLKQLSDDANRLFGFSLSVQKCEVSTPGDPVSFIGFTVDALGYERPNVQKLQFKLRYLPRPLTRDQELLRFLALYYIGGYAIPEYQYIAKRLHFHDIDVTQIDEETDKKLKYVLGMKVSDIIRPGFRITDVNVFLLSRGWTPAGIRPVSVPVHHTINA